MRKRIIPARLATRASRLPSNLGLSSNIRFDIRCECFLTSIQLNADLAGFGKQGGGWLGHGFKNEPVAGVLTN